jgi:hypothetical protein
MTVRRWSAQPNVGQISLISAWGWVAALLVSLAGFAPIALLTIVIERHRHGALLSGVTTQRRGWRRFLHGPWPLVAGAVALALGNFATLYLAGRPWGITSAFALCGSKILTGLGVDVASWGYWQPPAPISVASPLLPCTAGCGLSQLSLAASSAPICVLGSA